MSDKVLPNIEPQREVLIEPNRIITFGQPDTDGYYIIIDVQKIIEDKLSSKEYLATIPVPIKNFKALLKNNIIYIIGGVTPDKRNSMLTYNINTKVWTSYEYKELELEHHQIFYHDNYMYVLGGFNGDQFVDSIYSVFIDEQSSYEINIAGKLPQPSAYFSIYINSNKLYLIGGYSDTGYSNGLYTAKLTYSHEISNWTRHSNYPIRIASSKLVKINNMLFSCAGWGIDGYVPLIYSIDLDSPISNYIWGLERVPFMIDTESDHFKVSKICIIKDKLYLLS
jgi:hypothetical protein